MRSRFDIVLRFWRRVTWPTHRATYSTRIVWLHPIETQWISFSESCAVLAGSGRRWILLARRSLPLRRPAIPWRNGGVVVVVDHVRWLRFTQSQLHAWFDRELPSNQPNIPQRYQPGNRRQRQRKVTSRSLSNTIQSLSIVLMKYRTWISLKL